MFISIGYPLINLPTIMQALVNQALHLGAGDSVKLCNIYSIYHLSIYSESILCHLSSTLCIIVRPPEAPPPKTATLATRPEPHDERPNRTVSPSLEPSKERIGTSSPMGFVAFCFVQSKKQAQRVSSLRW